MKLKQIIKQIVYNWTLTLPIDGQSGESIVTARDIDRLYTELISAIPTLLRMQRSAGSLKEILFRLKSGFVARFIAGKPGIPVRGHRPV